MHIKNRLPKVRDELLLINALSLVLLLVVIFFPSSILRSLIGIPFVLFFPGYVTLALLFPNKNDISVVERVALSLALSIVIASFLGLLLSFSPVGLKLFPSIISLYSLILIFSVIKWVLKSNSFKKGLEPKELKNLKLNLTLAFSLMILILTLMRFLPASFYPYAPIHYDGTAVFNYRYLINTGHFPNNLPIYGYYTQNINRAGDPLLLIAILNGFLQVITNLPGSNQFSLCHVVVNPRHIILSICLSIILALICLSISRRYAGERKLSIGEEFLVMLFSLSSSSTIILGLTGWNCGYGFVFFLVVMYFLLKRKIDVRNTFLLLLFAVYLMIVYHTMALMFAALMVVAIFYKFLFKRGSIDSTFALTYLTIFGAYLVYLYTSFFGTIVSQSQKFIFIILGEAQPYLPLKEVNFPGDISFLTVYGISIITGAIPLLLLFVYLIPHFPHALKPQLEVEDEDKHIFNTLFITLSLAIVGFFGYMGMTGVLHRGKEYVAYFSVLAFSILTGLIADKKNSFKKILIISAIIAIITSSYVYLNTGAHHYHLTITEKRGNEWVLKYVPNEDVVFTDLRLSAMLVANGHFKVIGLLDPPPVSENLLRERLHAIFYGNNSSRAIKELESITTTTGENFRCLLFSKRMAKGYPEPSIYIGPSGVKPAPINFLEKYDKSISVNKIYTNSVITICVKK